MPVATAAPHAPHTPQPLDGDRELEAQQVAVDLVLDDRRRNCRTIGDVVGQLRTLCDELRTAINDTKAAGLRERDARLRLGAALIQARRGVPRGMWARVLGSLGLNPKTVDASMRLAAACCDDGGRMRPVDFERLRGDFLDRLRRMAVLDANSEGAPSLTREDRTILATSSLARRTLAAIVRVGTIDVDDATLDDIRRLMGVRPFPGGVRFVEKSPETGAARVTRDELLTRKAESTVDGRGVGGSGGGFDPNDLEIAVGGVGGAGAGGSGAEEDEDDEDFDDDEAIGDPFADDEEEGVEGEEELEDDDDFEEGPEDAVRPGAARTASDQAGGVQRPGGEGGAGGAANGRRVGARGACGPQLSLGELYGQADLARHELAAFVAREDLDIQDKAGVVAQIRELLAKAVRA